jgi:CcmD family protein
MKNFDFLFWAYNVIWIGIGGYIVFLVQRLKSVGDRLDRLEKG